MAHRADPLTADRGGTAPVPARSGPIPRRQALTIAAVVVLAVLEWAWFSWYLNEPLPNALRSGSGASTVTIRRSNLLWRAWPGVVPGIPRAEALLYSAGQKLGHVEYLPQRVPIVLTAALIAAAATGLGQLLLAALGLRRELSRWERLPLSYGLGTSALALLTLAFGRLGWLAPWPVRLGLLALAAGGWLGALRWVPGAGCRVPGVGGRGSGAGGRHMKAQAPAGETRGSPGASPAPEPARTSAEPSSYPTPNPRHPAPDPRHPSPGTHPPARNPRHLGPIVALLVVVAPFLVVMALGAMLPTIDYDAIEYHLEGPKEYYLAGRIRFLEHNVYTSMPFAVEMLHLLGMEVVDNWWWGALVGQLLVAGFAPAAAMLIGLTAWRWGSGRAGWFAAAIYLTTPWIYRIAAIPYVEGPLCYYHAALVWAAGWAWTASPAIRTRAWGLVGLLAGGAMACKYPGLVSAVVPFGLLALAHGVKTRSWRLPAAFAIGVAAIIGPWLVKNVIDTGNPVYPLGYRVFGGRQWSEAQEVKWSAAHGPRPVSWPALVDGLLDIAGRSDWQSPLYTAFVPLALLRPRSRRAAVLLLGYAAYLFATWWLLTHRLDRFWLPILPTLAVLAGLGADWTRSRAWGLVRAVVVAAGVFCSLVYDSSALAGYNEWTADLIRQRTVVPQTLNRPLSRLDEDLPPGTRVLLVGQAAVFYTRQPIVYNTVFNRETIETLTRDRSPDQVARAFADLGLDYIYVDWNEISRFRNPGNYGFTAYVTPELFDGLVASGVLGPPTHLGLQQEIYPVRRRGERRGPDDGRTLQPSR